MSQEADLISEIESYMYEDLLEEYTFSESPVSQEEVDVAKYHIGLGSSMRRPKVFFSFLEGPGTFYGRDAGIQVASNLQIQHESSLWKDDVDDDDKERRDGNSYWYELAQRIGNEEVAKSNTIDMAINAVVLPFRDLNSPGLDDKAELIRVMGKTISMLTEGQSQDNYEAGVDSPELVQDYRDEERRYDERVRLKTGALIEAPAVCGAIMSDADMEAASEWGQELGWIYQVQDDIYDNHEDNKKGRFSDAQQPGQSLLWIRALENDETGRTEEVLSQDNPDEEELEEIWELARENGTADELVEDMKGRQAYANQLLDEIEWQNPEYRRYLEVLPAELIRRAETALE